MENFINIYKIIYSDSLLLQNSEWDIIDNRENLRPDWYEYWPIRNYLKSKKMNRDEFYGFFSPRFFEKTGLERQDIFDHVVAGAKDFDVFTFSPVPSFNCNLINQFQRHKLSIPRDDLLLKDVLKAIGVAIDVDAKVIDSRGTIYCNYLVARPSFWYAWLDMCEKIFDICEDDQHPLSALLNKQTSYQGATTKIFFIEDMASILLATQPWWAVKNHNIFHAPWGQNDAVLKERSIIHDALKIAHVNHGFADYMNVFYKTAPVIK